MSQADFYQGLGQILPQETCLTCDVCCRFAELQSPLAPFFTEAEIAGVRSSDIARGWFPDLRGSRIRLVPEGEGCRCPHFDPATQHCGIYEARPLDCRIYPFALYWDELGKDVLLGMDTKCPFIRDLENHPALLAFAKEVQAFIESSRIVDLLRDHPDLIGPFQSDVLEISPLCKVTEALQRHGSARARSADAG